MADFKAHVLVAAVASGVAATGLAMTRTISHQEAIVYFTLGIVGGLLPDLDSDSSVPIRIAHRVLSSLAALLLVLHFSDRFSLFELVLLGALAYATVRYVGFTLFSRYTVHRGIIHSLPAAAVAGLLTVLAADRWFDAPHLHAWLCGVFVLFGFLIHLLLDEIYSIDLLGRRIKRSFGSAVKFGDFTNLPGTALLYAATVGLFLLTPPAAGLIDLALSEQTYEQVFRRLLPADWSRLYPGLLSAPR